MNQTESQYAEVLEAEYAYVYPPQTMPWYLRLVIGTIGLGLIALLITAGCLTPAPAGFGTHQQLGLPPCSFQVMFDGKPCPSCGMTTSWSHMMRGQVISSFRANPGGALLAIVCVVMAPWLFISGLQGKWFAGLPPYWITLTIALGLVVVTFTNWIFQLLR
jgi:hypothetical protein